jgi:hypothetical protein
LSTRLTVWLTAADRPCPRTRYANSLHFLR